MQKIKRPFPKNVKVTNTFWKNYLDKIRLVTMPYVFSKFEETGYFTGLKLVAKDCKKLLNKEEYKTPPFDNGLVLESIRGASDFLSQYYDEKLDKQLDEYIEIIGKAQDASGDGFLTTRTTLVTPTWRWGENGGDIIIQHDLYNQGALIEAGISHYLATKKTTLLTIAVKSAKLITSYIGYPPKHNIIPGHSLPEEAFIKLYRLFRDTPELNDFILEHDINYNDYLDLAIFWYDNRGNYQGRTLSNDKRFQPKYNQDHLTFSKQTTAEGHSVRAALCYTGATMVAYETGRKDFETALDLIWDNIANRKLHISGGIGTRHDIEGFDNDYNLPHDAYLETCAAIAFAFFNGEMNLLKQDAKYFDYFERSLYNNILASIGESGTKYFYQNPLISDGTISRWGWHGCPCCPPMLLKIHSSLSSYIYAYSDTDLYLNMHIDSELNENGITAKLSNGLLTINSKTLKNAHIRIPEYAENFTLTVNGEKLPLKIENGYAVVNLKEIDGDIKIDFNKALKRVVSNKKATDNNGQVAVMHGPILYCAEGFDNEKRVDFTIAKDANLKCENNIVTGKTADGKTFTLIPYYTWCNRESDDTENKKMRVWFKQENFPDDKTLDEIVKDKLYATL